MVAWYKHHIPAWMDGTESLNDGAYRIYHVICQLIYLNEGPIELNERGIAGRARQHIVPFRRHLKALFDSGKLTLLDGKISNDRAAIELESVRKKRLASAKGGGLVIDNSSITLRVLPELSPSTLAVVPGNPLKSLEAPSSALSLEKRREEKKESCPSPKGVRTKHAYSEQFEKGFWEPYPRTPNMGKQEAWQEWKKLSPEEQSSACASIPAFKAFLRSKTPDYEVIHACRFLKKRRFEGYAEVLTPRFDVKRFIV